MDRAQRTHARSEDPETRARALRLQLRAGELYQAELELSAALGDVAARLALGLPPRAGARGLDRFSRDLDRAQPWAAVRGALAPAWTVLQLWEDPLPGQATPDLTQEERWCPCCYDSIPHQEAPRPANDDRVRSVLLAIEARVAGEAKAAELTRAVDLLRAPLDLMQRCLGSEVLADRHAAQAARALGEAAMAQGRRRSYLAAASLHSSARAMQAWGLCYAEARERVLELVAAALHPGQRAAESA
ncbi:MAG TPA: hypothetical protein DEA08_36540 [Planctomycetes bacterium]|nr:hypothetical protein [Planctomycetota bacterium]